MMKKVLSKRLTFMLIAAVFMLSFAGTAVSQTQQTDVAKVTGTIISIGPDSGKVTVKEESGRFVTLTAGPDVDLEDFSVGDQVVAEHTPDMVVRSITKQ